MPAKREALRLATWDSTIALMFALTINASILILAAATFYTAGENDVAEIDKAHLLLEPLLGSSLAPIRGTPQHQACLCRIISQHSTGP